MASSRKESSGGEGRLITYGGRNRTRVCTMTGKFLCKETSFWLEMLRILR